MIKKVMAMVLILMLAVSMTACGNSNITAAGAESREKITLGINDWPGSYWWLAVDKLGYFKEQSVDVEVQLFSNYTDGLNALMSGKIDMFVPALADIIPGYVNGADIKVIMVQDFSAGADGLVASPNISSVEELKGRNIAIEFGGSDHLFLLKALENAGLSEKDVNLVNMSTGDASNAFIAGQVDAAAVWEPSLSMAQQETGGNILATSGDKEFEGLIPAILAVNGDSLKTKREEMKSVMKAWYSARDAYDIDPEKFAEAVAGGAEVTAEEFLELMKGCDVRTMEDNAEAFAAGDTYVSLPYCAKMLAGFLQYNGLIDSMPDNFNDLFDSSLFEEVYEEMK